MRDMLMAADVCHGMCIYNPEYGDIVVEDLYYNEGGHSDSVIIKGLAARTRRTVVIALGASEAVEYCLPQMVECYQVGGGDIVFANGCWVHLAVNQISKGMCNLFTAGDGVAGRENVGSFPSLYPLATIRPPWHVTRR